MQYLNEIIYGLIAAVAVLFIIVIVLMIKLNKEKKRMDALTTTSEELDLEKILRMIQKDINDIQTGNILREQKISDLQTDLSFTIRKVGFIRYNAFQNEQKGRGGDLSFSIAFLDGYNNGFVLSSIYASSQSISYAKPIKNKESNIPLSDEEVMAIEKAIRGDVIS
ncbi:MAG: DUF4446 family protein [Ezakiella sp.]|nr:DUF4446 family protein [Ezakiella sp.]MDD7762240.1 DUF4446 family protein [Bacillota bacterium]MDY3947262.1 DUF4446 family protein [Ezakiella sp.]